MVKISEIADYNSSWRDSDFKAYEFLSSAVCLLAHVECRDQHDFKDIFKDDYDGDYEDTHIDVVIHPALYLIHIGVEHSIKHILDNMGYTKKKLRNFGHNLESLLKEIGDCKKFKEYCDGDISIPSGCREVFLTTVREVIELLPYNTKEIDLRYAIDSDFIDKTNPGRMDVNPIFDKTKSLIGIVETIG